MFKILTFAVLGYLFYRLVMPAKSLDEGDSTGSLNQEPDSGDYVEYEEIDE